VSGIEHLSALDGIGFQSVSRHIPRCRNIMLFEKIENTRQGYVGTEFSSGNRRRRRHASRNPPRDGIEIEGHADKMSSHGGGNLNMSPYPPSSAGQRLVTPASLTTLLQPACSTGSYAANTSVELPSASEPNAATVNQPEAKRKLQGSFSLDMVGNDPDSTSRLRFKGSSEPFL